MTATLRAADVLPAASARGPLVLEAHALAKDFRLSRGLHGEVLSAARDVSFGLYRSAVVALVGESGSGKSTVARMLAGQERPTSGQILLDGAEVRPWARGTFRSYKGDVQMVFQDPFASLNSVHTVRYTLRRPVRLHQRAKRKDAVAAELQRLLERVRLTPPDQFLAKYPHELSGGQRQRVAIARALVVSPDLLVCDEITSALDVSVQATIVELLRRLQAERHLSLVFITHNLALVRSIAQSVLVLSKGRVVESGPVARIFERPEAPYTVRLMQDVPKLPNGGPDARLLAT